MPILFFGCLLFFQFLFALSPEEGLKKLLEGNLRYKKDKLAHPNLSQERREALICKQSPYAIIVGCSDSRVAPDHIFDQGLGDLFVVRVAGNVIGLLELDSVQYAALSLGSVVVLVLGHENCGAVRAVLQNETSAIPSVAKLIAPSVENVRRKKSQCPLKESIQTNAITMRDFLRKDPVIEQLLQEKKIEVYAGYYDLQTGGVEILTK